MSAKTAAAAGATASQAPATQFDAVVVGAGVAGLYQLYRLRQLGLSGYKGFVIS